MSNNSSAAAALSKLLLATKGQTEKNIKNCPENRRLYQLGPGKATPLWLAGHLANTVDFLGNSIGLGLAPSLPPEFRKVFSPKEFGGPTITANAADYPSWDVIATEYSRVMGAFAEGVAKLSDEELAGAPKGKVPDPLKSMCQSIQDLASLNVVHDSHHRGQLALLANKPD